MSLEGILQRIGLCLLALAFAIALYRAVTVSFRPAQEEALTLRMGHWRLEEPVQRAFNEIARDYAEIRPGFRLQQVVVPDRIWRFWMRTQLVGESPPDLMNTGWVMTPDLLSRYFVPLTDYVAQPNPHNEGTDLEGVPWRNTFIDGLDGSVTFNQELLEYVGVNFTYGTFRLLYNRDLLEKVTGERELGNLNLAEFVELSEQVRAYAQRTEQWIVPASGTGTRTVALFTRLFGSQTQRLSQDLRFRPDFNPGVGLEVLASAREGKWDLSHPSVIGGFHLIQQFGQQHNLGFLGMSQDDAAFLFLQGKALFVPGAIFNTSYIRELADFEVGILAGLPFISPEDPVFGKNTFGPNAEGISETALPLGITNTSDKFDLALDFLRFATTRASSEKFGFISGNLPTVVGARMNEEYAPFQPNVEGAFPSGFNLHTGFADIARVVLSQFHELVHPNGGLEAFMEKVEPQFERNLETDYRRTHTNLRRAILRNDILAEGFLRHEGDDPAGKGARLLSGQVNRQNDFYQYR